ncbi:MAG: DUF1905 domain-containing protein [Fluviicola sp.]
MKFKGDLLLEKMKMKGGWTYAVVPISFPKTIRAFGWVIVSGKIDSIQFEKVKLMPLGDGRLFLPVKAEWRKKIKKEEGDWISVDLFVDEQTLKITQELKEVFDFLPDLKVKYENLNETKKAQFLDAYNNARTEIEKETALKRLS